MHHKQTKSCPNACLLLLIFLLTSYYFTKSVLNLTDPFQGLPQGLKGSLYGAYQWILLKKTKIGRNNHSLPFVVTPCHSLSLVVPLLATRCTTRCHSFTTCCTTRCHLLSLYVSLVCLFMNDLLKPYYEDKKN